MTPTADVVVVGAGPYGLSVGAQLRALGVKCRVFGPPMSFWLAMPKSLNLKSFAFATSLAVPAPRFDFPRYCRARGLPDLEPCTMQSFAEYGVWVQQRLLPDVDPAVIDRVECADRRTFLLTARGGQRVVTRNVVVAVGVGPFAHVPAALSGPGPDWVTHSSEHTDFSRFAGKEVAVVGAGASALESATLLFEAGAKPFLLVRGPGVVFHTARFDPERPLLERLRNPNSALGPSRKSWLLERFPMALHYLPASRRVRFTRSYLGPAGPWWLYDRFHGNVDVRVRCGVTGARVVSGKVVLELREDGQPRTQAFDHVIAGTGFDVDVDRLDFLAEGVRRGIRRVERAPALSRHFESSVPGLYFVGTAAAMSFGPLFRFVAGARYAAPVVARRLAAELGRSRRTTAAADAAPSLA